MKTNFPLLILLLTAAAISGCTTSDVGEGSDQYTQICTEEKKLGSYIRKKHCRSIKQFEREQRDAQKVLDETISPTGHNER